MKVAPLTILAYEGPILRAYLSMMRRAGWRPRCIILMVQRNHPATKAPVGRWLPGGLRWWYAQQVQEHSLNYWPRDIRATHPALVEAMVGPISRICGDPGGVIDEMFGRLRYQDCAERVERVVVGNLKDEALSAALFRVPTAAVLYTGGGIVPAKLLDIPGLRFLHVHPGNLPEVRGADGLLWSMLVRGRPGVSCFYMAPGIDTGDVIETADYPPLRFDISGMHRPDDQTLYRAIFSFYDPILRASFWVGRILEMGTDPADLPARAQDPGEGTRYRFMDAATRRKALKRLFASEPGHQKPEVARTGCRPLHSRAPAVPAAV